MRAMRVLLAGFMVFLAACATTVPQKEKIPLPSDIKISLPSPQTPKDLAKLLGRWEGAWWSPDVTAVTSRLKSILIVEKIEKEKVFGIYAWEENIDWGIRKPGYFRFVSQVEKKNDKYEFLASGKRSTILFVFDPQKERIKGEVKNSPQRFYINYTK